MQKMSNEVVAADCSDSTGDEAYNLDHSQQRAEAVERALTDAGIDGDRVVALWFGTVRRAGFNAGRISRLPSWTNLTASFGTAVTSCG